MQWQMWQERKGGWLQPRDQGWTWQRGGLLGAERQLGVWATLASATGSAKALGLDWAGEITEKASMAPGRWGREGARQITQGWGRVWVILFMCEGSPDKVYAGKWGVEFLLSKLTLVAAERKEKEICTWRSAVLSKIIRLSNSRVGKQRTASLSPKPGSLNDTTLPHGLLDQQKAAPFAFYLYDWVSYKAHDSTVFQI